MHLLVNNAGLARGVARIPTATAADEARLGGDVRRQRARPAARHAALRAGRWCARDAGHVINLGSLAGLETYEGGSVYCASKASVRVISKALRLELLGSGVRVTCINPGLADETEFSVVRLGSQEKADAVYAGMTPLTPTTSPRAIEWVADAAGHVNIEELNLQPVDQASAQKMHAAARVSRRAAVAGMLGGRCCCRSAVLRPRCRAARRPRRTRARGAPGAAAGAACGRRAPGSPARTTPRRRSRAAGAGAGPARRPRGAAQPGRRRRARRLELLEPGDDGSVVAGGTRRWTLRYEAGPLGVAEGGTVFFQAPPFWGWSHAAGAGPRGARLHHGGGAGGQACSWTSFTADVSLLAIGITGRALAEGETLPLVYGAGPAGARADRFATATRCSASPSTATGTACARWSRTRRASWCAPGRRRRSC